MPTPLARLASLDLLRSFVAVGRRMSITQAAEDLFLTQSAVSRQIHALEKALGAKLLVRGHRSIRFTPEGERLFAVADTAIAQLQEVAGGIGVPDERRPVTVSATAGFAGLWLMPRVGRLAQLHPQIDLRISASPRVVDLRSEGFDLAIRFGPRASALPGALRLFGDSVAPVAQPALRIKPLTSPADLADCVLLEFDEQRRYRFHWSDWLTERGWAGASSKGIVHFNQYDQVINAALAGQGIALGRMELLAIHIAERRLVLLAPPRVREGDYGHWLIQNEEQPRQDVRDVVQWIRAEIGEQERLLAA